jgi:hypothetical protein
MRPFTRPPGWTALVGAAALLLLPQPARAFTIEDVHFTEPPPGHSEFVVSFTIHPEDTEVGHDLALGVADEDRSGPGATAPLGKITVQMGTDHALPVVSGRLFHVTCQGGKLLLNGKATGESRAELALTVQLQDSDGNPIGSLKHAGDQQVSCTSLGAGSVGASGPPEPMQDVRTHVHAPRKPHPIGDEMPFVIVVWDGTRTCKRVKRRGKLHFVLFVIDEDGERQKVAEGNVGSPARPQIVSGTFDTKGRPAGNYHFWVRITEKGTRVISEGHHHFSLEES